MNVRNVLVTDVFVSYFTIELRSTSFFRRFKWTTFTLTQPTESGLSSLIAKYILLASNASAHMKNLKGKSHRFSVCLPIDRRDHPVWCIYFRSSNLSKKTHTSMLHFPFCQFLDQWTILDSQFFSLVGTIYVYQFSMAITGYDLDL